MTAQKNPWEARGTGRKELYLNQEQLRQTEESRCWGKRTKEKADKIGWNFQTTFVLLSLS